MALVKYNNNSISAVTSAASMPSGAMTHIKTLTASSSATLSFVNGSSDVVLDSTYPIYVFKFINIHPATNNAEFQFQGDTGTNTNYNQTITSTVFGANHKEDGSEAGLSYFTAFDQAQGTAFQTIQSNVHEDDDNGASGTLTIYNPSSSVFVKNFISTTNSQQSDTSNLTHNHFVAGYFNLTTALTRFQFKFSSGNMDSGKIKLYGIKDS